MNDLHRKSDVTGLVLAGGQGLRMGGVDKGLQPFAGRGLVEHALQRLRPQVGTLMVNANRNLQAYADLGVPVCPDEHPGFAGPLAGMAAGLARCRTPWLVTVPCDTPGFPLGLVARLMQAAHEDDAQVAIAATVQDGRLQPEPVFCLVRADLRPSLLAFLQAGQRKVDRWTAQHRCATALFETAADFDNLNTLQDLQRAAAPAATPAPD
jgi:molybdopterin-guanine dinucleotide biosynthesis protein A